MRIIALGRGRVHGRLSKRRGRAGLCQACGCGVCRRCCGRNFAWEQRVAVVVHGGVIMAVMTTFSGSDVPYHRWYVLNCGGYEIAIDEKTWAEKRRFESCKLFGERGQSKTMVAGAGGIVFSIVNSKANCHTT